MRQIKFRAWDTKKKRFLVWEHDYNLILEAIPQDAGDEWTERCIVEQYTGLKDKNGTKIFEGDIIKHVITGNIFEMCFNEGRFLGLSSNDWIASLEPWSENNIEVIGNIHENPELLEGE